MTGDPATGKLGELTLRPSEPVRRRRRGLTVLIGALVLLVGGCAALSGYLLSLNLKIEANVGRDKASCRRTPNRPPVRSGYREATR